MRRDVLALALLLVVVATAIWVRSDGGRLIVTVSAPMRALQAATSPPQPPADADWDAQGFGGRPRIALPQTFLYPPILRRWAPDPQLTFASYIVHVWLAGLAIYAAARTLRIARVPAFALGLAFLLATDLARPITETSAEVIFRAVWLALLGAAILACAERASWLRQVTVAAVAIVIAAAGSPRTQAYGLATLIGTCVLVAAWTHGSRWRAAVQGALATASIVALCAPAVFPTLRLWRSMWHIGGLASSEPVNGSWKTDAAADVQMDPRLAQALQDLRPARVISACPQRVDGIHLRALDVRSVGGYGGVFSADYARFVNLARSQNLESPLPYVGIPEGPQMNMGLLQFLGPEYVVACGDAEGELVRTVDQVRIYRVPPTLAQAVWTCMPARVGRQEIVHQLGTRRYDATLSLRERGPTINVRWAPEVNDAARVSAEVALHLVPEGEPDGRTRRYELLDASPTSVEAIVTSPLVEDTAGLNRSTFVTERAPVVEFAERPTEWLLGLTPCPEVRATRPIESTRDGRIVVAVDAPADGVVFFPETYYSLRTAAVDDRPVDVMKVNLAFSAVPVPAGAHRVELGAKSAVLAVDWVVSLLVVAGWGRLPLSAWWRRRAARRAESRPAIRL